MQTFADQVIDNLEAFVAGRPQNVLTQVHAFRIPTLVGVLDFGKPPTEVGTLTPFQELAASLAG
jgi:hypothetical protein